MRRNDFLLDTHILLWSLLDDKRVNDRIEEIMFNAENTIYVAGRAGLCIICFMHNGSYAWSFRD